MTRRADLVSSHPARAPKQSETRHAQGLFAQRKGRSGGGTVAQTPIFAGAGRPMPDSVRSDMESRFGRSFSQVRIHDDATAHDSAHALGAKAYAAGDRIGFARGQYAPQTEAGRALLAHELAHTIQQGGVQLKADGALPLGADHQLEAEADAAARAVVGGGAMPSFSRIGAPAIHRSTETPATGSTKKAAQTEPLPDQIKIIAESPAGAGGTHADAEIAFFRMPVTKGKGQWVKKAYDEAAKGGKLIFKPNFPKDGGPMSAYMETTSTYQSVWLNNYGFKTLADVAEAVKTSENPSVKKARELARVKAVLEGFADNKQGGLDIDHIVERQLQGTSSPSNLQLLVAAKNQDSGRQTYAKLVELTESVRKTRPNLSDFRLFIRAVEIPASSEGDMDACFEIEQLVRNNHLSGTTFERKQEGDPVTLSTGAGGETAFVGPAETRLDKLSNRIVPGMRLTKYTRSGAKPANKGKDTVLATLDPMLVDPDAGKVAAFDATYDEKVAGSVGAAAAGQAAKANASAVEGRKLTLRNKTQHLSFHYPYLSPGEITKLDVDENGSVSGTGKIHPTLKFLGDLDIKYGDNLLALASKLDPKKFRSPFPGLTFTGGELDFKLAPEFKPEGNLQFKVAAASRTLMTGSVAAGLEGGRFSAVGTLTPAELPGIKDAKGEIAYTSTNGWSGKLTASTSSFPNAPIDVVVGFRQEGDKVVKYASGGITVRLANDKTLKLGASWGEGGLVYSGSLAWPKPFPIVDNVDLVFSYGGDVMKASGHTTFKWRQWEGDLTVHYNRKDGEEGKLSGKGSVKVETKNKKAKGALHVDIDETGQLSGAGKMSYQLTDKITPELGVTLTKTGKLTVSGAVKVGDIHVFDRYPKEDGKRELMKLSTRIKLPSPFPAVNPVLKLSAGVNITYGIGPGVLTGVELAGQFDPLEEDPNIKASLKGAFVIPAHVGLVGSFGGEIGLEVLGGAIGATGGLAVKPGANLNAKAVTAIEAAYEKGAFAFKGDAHLDAALVLTLGIDLTGTFYVLYGAWEKTWAYPVKSYQFPVGQNIRVNAGQISYSTLTGLKLPSLSDISIEPKDLDPMKMVSDIMSRKKENESKK